MDADQGDAIAIIGISCRFPGADGPSSFWELLRDGVDAITEVPHDRFDIEKVYDPRPSIPGKLVSRWGGFLKDPDHFDASFFGISPREASAADPQQRLLLESAWEALEDAGQVPERIAGSATGVFVGLITTDYWDFQVQDPETLDIYSMTGNHRSVASGRISYVLGLQGPSLTVDSACSSSLVAIHLACQSLRCGESTMALAGGVNLVLHPEGSLGFSQARMLAPDGRCKFGDASGNGFVRSDGVAMMVLKPLDAARRDGDPVYAVIRGSAASNDGNTDLMMTPSRVGQEATLRSAYRIAGISPARVQYVEAHGTGTSVGDPVELAALAAVLSEGRAADRPCVVGSVKTNIGHTEGAAGVAGMIKTALSLKHRTIPKSLHQKRLNPAIAWDRLPLVLADETRPWPFAEGAACAGVSSFGISGTNVHVVLEEAPIRPPAPLERTGEGGYLLPLSARSPEALSALVRRWQEFLPATPESLADICFTAAVRRTHHDHRLALTGSSREALSEQLGAFLEGQVLAGMTGGEAAAGRRPRVVFVFPGQGSQWVGMGRELLRLEPAFRETLERCSAAIERETGWSLLDLLLDPEGRALLEEVDVIQPALFALQISLADLWRSWGVEPAAVVGQSMGEVAASYVAGALDLDDAVRVICRRSALVKSTSLGGAMAVVELSLEEARAALSGYESDLSIAVSSSPRSTVLSGDSGAMDRILAGLEERGVFCRRVKVDYASHSQHMDPLESELRRRLVGLRPKSGTVPFFSTVAAGFVDGAELDPGYWWNNLRQPVLFSAAVERLAADGHDLFLEVSPHPLLLNPIQQTLEHAGAEAAAFGSLRRDEAERLTLLATLGAYWARGGAVDWPKTQDAAARCVSLPTYPWQRERFWHDAPGLGRGRSPRHRELSGGAGHPLLGHRVESPAHPGTELWEIEIDSDRFPYFDGHRVQEAVVLPAAAYVEMALAAAAELGGAAAHVLRRMTFREVCFLPPGEIRRLQLALFRETSGDFTFRFYRRDETDAWILHCDGELRLSGGEELHPSDFDEVQKRCPEILTEVQHYAAMEARGIFDGAEFRGLERIWRRPGEALGRLRPAGSVDAEAPRYQIHPALLDVCFQVAMDALPAESDALATYLPVSIDRLCFARRPTPGAELWSHVVLRPVAGLRDAAEIDLRVSDADGPILEATSFRFQRLDGGRGAGVVADDWFYQAEWRPAPPLEAPVLPAGAWLVFGDRSGVGDGLVRRLREAGADAFSIVAGDAFEALGEDSFSLDPARKEDFVRLLAGLGSIPLGGVVYLWGLDAPTADVLTPPLLEEVRIRVFGGLLHLVQALAERGPASPPRLWLVTRGAQVLPSDGKEGAVAQGLAQSPLWGFGRVLFYENPELRCVRVDLGPDDGPGVLWAELGSEGEDEVALRGESRQVQRMVRRAPETARREPVRRAPAADEAFRVEIPDPGVLDHLVPSLWARRVPGPGQVEIKVRSAGLNFLNVMSAMGICPGFPAGVGPLGLECAGTVEAVGEGVAHLQVGDEVLAIAHDSLASHVLADARLVVPKPAGWTLDQAAGFPIVFFTSYYGLIHLARLGPGERVLIHSAAGGVGLSALQLAQRAGAEVFATAGTEEKREMLRSLGVEHVFDSRSLEFAAQILERTGGEGVDVVLNSLSGDAIPASLSLLRPYGRFVELGKKDIYQNARLGLEPFQRNLSYFAVDVERLIRERPGFLGPILHRLVADAAAGELAPLPVDVFPVSEVSEAFRTMAQGRHTGKLVIRLDDPEVRIAATKERIRLHADASYLVSGGLGAIGLTVAAWLVEQGARHLVLLGRSGAGAEAKKVIARLENVGARIVIAEVDVADPQALAVVFAQVDQTLPPLRGVIHSAGLLDDAVLLQTDLEKLRRVMAPKILGAWNLHRLTADSPLDFFWLFSSMAALIGSPGQGNYVAANEFLDMLAYHRRSLGLPAVAIDWGPWSEVGLAARADRGGRLADRGLGSLTPEQGGQVLGRLLEQETVRIGVVPELDLDLWCEFYPAARNLPLFVELWQSRPAVAASARPAAEGRPTREGLLPLGGAARQQLVEADLAGQVARVLRLPAAKIDPRQPIKKFGLDSLMALELKNRIEIDFGVNVPIVRFLQGLNVSDLASEVLDSWLGPESDAAPDEASPGGRIGADAEAAGLLARIDTLSDDEVDALLRDLSPGEEAAP